MSLLINILLPVLLSSFSEYSEGEIIGKWAGYTDFRYYEIHIDKQRIHACNHPFFDNWTYDYTYRNDTLYLDLADFIVPIGIEWMTDSTIITGIFSERGMLWRLDPDIKTCDEIDKSDTCEIEAYNQQFLLREIEASYCYLNDSILIEMDIDDEMFNKK